MIGYRSLLSSINMLRPDDVEEGLDRTGFGLVGMSISLKDATGVLLN